MNYLTLNGRSLALLLEGDDNDWSVVCGIARQEGNDLFLDYDANKQPFAIQREWLDRIKPVPQDLSERFMNADLFLPLLLGRCQTTLTRTTMRIPG